MEEVLTQELMGMIMTERYWSMIPIFALGVVFYESGTKNSKKLWIRACCTFLLVTFKRQMKRPFCIRPAAIKPRTLLFFASNSENPF